MTEMPSSWSAGSYEYYIVERDTGVELAGPAASFGDAMADASRLQEEGHPHLRLRWNDGNRDRFVSVPLRE